ncbi:MAG: DMT family transporter [Candidatus Eisenbacteria bacterium]
MDRQTRAYAYALLAVLFWSTVASAFELSLRSLSPVRLLLYSSAASALILGGVLALQRRFFLFSTYSARDYLRSALLGLLNPFLYYLVLFKAYALLPGQEAQPLNYTWALALALLSVPLLRQRIRPASLLAILISLAGVLVISTRGRILALQFTDPVGVSLALGSSILWALFWIFNMRDRRDETAKLFLCCACGFVFVLGYALLTGEARWPDATGLAAGAYVGFFEMGITFVVWLKALGFSRTTAQVSNLVFLSPFVSLVLLHYVVGEEIYASSVAGLALIIAGIIIQKRTAG